MQRRDALVVGETYHIYNRGAHKQLIFNEEADYARFAMLLYLQNSPQPLVMRDILDFYKGRSLGELFTLEREPSRLVDIHAYCMMPNHFHIVLQQVAENGVSKFMKKLATSYSMYFNTKYEHSGVLFQGRFKSSHVGEEAYYRWIFSYVHLNPIDLIESKWEKEGIRNKENVRRFLLNYAPSSYSDYLGGTRPERSILSLETAPDFLRTDNDLEDLLQFTKDGPLGSPLGSDSMEVGGGCARAIDDAV